MCVGFCDVRIWGGVYEREAMKRRGRKVLDESDPLVNSHLISCAGLQKGVVGDNSTSAA